MARDAAVGRLLLLACVLTGLARLPETTDAVLAENRRGADVPDVHGIPAAKGMPEGTPDLFAAVREHVPEDEPVRLVVRGTNCVSLPINAGAAATFWTQYHLLPRPLTCDPGARWWVFVGESPGGTIVPPPGSEVVTVRPTLLLVRLPGAA